MSISIDAIERGARAIAESYGHDPDADAPRLVMCTSDNQPVPYWQVYEEQALACLLASRDAGSQLVAVSGETRMVHDPFLGKDVQISDRLVDRLRGRYATGPTMPNGEPEFGWREFPVPPIQQQAAEVIERLANTLEKCAGALAATADEKDIVRFTGKWKSLGIATVSTLLNEADAALELRAAQPLANNLTGDAADSAGHCPQKP